MQDWGFCMQDWGFACKLKGFHARFEVLYARFEGWMQDWRFGSVVKVGKGNITIDHLFVFVEMLEKMSGAFRYGAGCCFGRDGGNLDPVVVRRSRRFSAIEILNEVLDG